MIEKIKNLVSSIRFWQLVIGAIIVILGQEGVISPEIANTIAGLLGVSVTLGTVDKLAKK
jgi:hypothetical protein